MRRYSIGIDFGSNSVRALIADLEKGIESGTGVCGYAGGNMGVYTDRQNHHLARQNPLEYLDAMKTAVADALKEAGKNKDFAPENIVGIGVDTTGSTPIPVTEKCIPLAAVDKFKNNLNAFAWMWKDHTSMEEARLITDLAAKHRPEYLKRCGNTYSSEWFWAKILHCLKTDSKVFDAAYSWVEFCDYIPAVLSGLDDVSKIKRSVCAAGHKAMFSSDWGGLPDQEFLALIDKKLADLRGRLFTDAYTSDKLAGHLSPEWASKLGLKEGTPIAVGAFDAHMGAVGSGIAHGKLVKIIGTSSCDLMTSEHTGKFPEIPGICGIVDGSVIPGLYGIEAGQSAVGDIMNWFVSHVCKDKHSVFAELTKEAEKLSPGESGLLALDWHNGNRCVLVDPKLTGMILGMTLHTSRAEIYRALIEATAFGARRILDRIEEHGIKIDEVITCGGIAEKNPLFMQIYADVLKRKMKISGSSQTCALGAVIFGALAAGKDKGGFASIDEAQKKLCSFKEKEYLPEKKHSEIYDKLYELYCELHDSFGVKGKSFDHYELMKKLLEISSEIKSKK